MLPFLKDTKGNYDANLFLNELTEAANNLGKLEAKISSYKFNNILVPMLNKKEAVSSMEIEGTQTTISDVLTKDATPNTQPDLINLEVHNHIKTIAYGSSYLSTGNFTNKFIQEIHQRMLDGIIKPELKDTLGKYKTADNHIENSSGRVIFIPPTYKETRKYMDELIFYMNDSHDGLNPLIKAAIIHSQFESIHPFSDGNGRVGRLLVSLYLYKARVINFPFFYISEAISQDKGVYYNMLTDSRNSDYSNWIKYFLSKIAIQAKKHIDYINSLNTLYETTKRTVKEKINSPKFEMIIELIFSHPVLNADLLMDELDVSRGQAIRYLNVLEGEHILFGNDRQRGRLFYFVDLLNLANGI